MESKETIRSFLQILRRKQQQNCPNEDQEMSRHGSLARSFSSSSGYTRVRRREVEEDEKQQQIDLLAIAPLIIIMFIILSFLFVFIFKFDGVQSGSIDGHIDQKKVPNDVHKSYHQLQMDPDDKIRIFWSLDYKKESATIEIRFKSDHPFDWVTIGFSDYGNTSNADLCLLWFDMKHKPHFVVSSHRRPMSLKVLIHLLFRTHGPTRTPMSILTSRMIAFC